MHISRLPRDEIETPDTAEILITQGFNTTAFPFNILLTDIHERGKIVLHIICGNAGAFASTITITAVCLILTVVLA